MSKLIYIKKKKGSALVLVLIATLLIMSLCTVSLSVSLSNMKMAGKVQSNSKEYYFMEKVAQEVIANLDGQLKSAEDNARNYMEKELFKKSYEEVANEVEVKALKNSKNNHIMINKMWLQLVKDPSSIDNMGGVNSTLYSQLFDNFFSEAYNRLYFSYCQEATFVLDSTLKNNGEPQNNDKYYETLCKITMDDGSKTKGYDGFTWDPSKSADNLSTWNKYKLNPNDYTFAIDIYGCKKPGGASSFSDDTKINIPEGRKIQGIMSIQPPTYEAVESARYKSSRLNPIYTNAILSNGNITFASGSQVLHGDVISMSKDVSFHENAQATIYGNVCASNNININAGSIANINEYNGTSVNLELKRKVYHDEDVFYDILQDEIMTLGMTGSTFGRVIEGTLNPYDNILPILFKDTKGGNSYCNNINIINGNSKTEYTTRNIMFSGDINIKNSNKSNLNINGIAITSTPGSKVSENDIVINDFKNNKNVSINGINNININRGYIGNTFISPDEKYSESNTRQCINKYRHLETTLTDGNGKSTTYKRDTLPSVLRARTSHLGTVSRNYGSFVNAGLLGGTVTNSEEPERIPVFDVSNKSKWSDTTTVKYLHNSGSNILDLKGSVLSGIIYCDGNLTIKNSSSTAGEIRGAVICSGDVKLEGNVNIVYSEDVIKKTLKGSKVSREFFVPGEMGSAFNLEVVDTTTDANKYSNSKARVKTSNERYIITKWSRGKLKGK